MTDTVTAFTKGGRVGSNIFTKIYEFDALRRGLVKLSPGPEKSKLRHKIREMQRGH